MTTGDWLKANTAKLELAGVGTARLDCLVLLEDATGKDRAWLLAHPEEELASELVNELASKLRRRQAHEPLAYIRGKTEFYGREFLINDKVLEPRPESETMIDMLKNYVKGPTFHMIDIGTGSGALAITAKLELPHSQVFAIDIDNKCLAVARRNAKKHSVSIDFYQGNLLDPLPPAIYHLPPAILANLPYVPDDYKLNEAAMNEPKIAIFGGPDGLDLYRQLFQQITDKKLNISCILTESLPFQHQQLAEIASRHNFKLAETRDFIQKFVNN